MTETRGGEHRCRPEDPDWPTAADWQRLREVVGGRLVVPESPLEACHIDSSSTACAKAVQQGRNPFFLEEQVGATQSSGWLGAWTSQPSEYAVLAESAQDVVAAVNFAREHRLKLVIKGTGHDYLGRSNAADSLMVWTHRMRETKVEEAFACAGAPHSEAAIPAVTVGAGTRWLEAYRAVAVERGRYVQGGGCASVGVAGGFIQGGGFGSFSRKFGIAAASMLEVEVVTADGQIVVANEHQHADLFWALRGGGGSTFGVVTRMTLRTHELPATFGIFRGELTAASDADFRRLLEAVIAFAGQNLLEENWGEQIVVRPDNVVELFLVFSGLSEAECWQIWQPFVTNLEEGAGSFGVEADSMVMPAAKMWDYDYLNARHPELVQGDGREGQPAGQYWWASNQAEVSRYIYSYQSRWLPSRLFEEASARDTAEILFRMSRHHAFSIHLNKGLAGASGEAVARSRRTAIHPAVFDAAGLLIMSEGETDAYPEIDGYRPDGEAGRRSLEAINAAMTILRDATPGAGTYSTETDFFLSDWQEECWGEHYPRLLAIKQKYDPAGLFWAHHGVGSENWSEDGMRRQGAP